MTIGSPCASPYALAGVSPDLKADKGIVQVRPSNSAESSARLQCVVSSRKVTPSEVLTLICPSRISAPPFYGRAQVIARPVPTIVAERAASGPETTT